jgi:O-succinylbenzoate synthase
MPELGIGALHALYLAAHPNCVYPTDVEASSRWFVEDLIDPPISVRDGIIEIDAAHRIRPRVNLDAIDRYAIKSRTVSR